MGFGSTFYLPLSVSVCLCLFACLRLGHCHHWMTSFQKIYGLYGLEQHTVEINGDVSMRDNRKGKIELDAEFCNSDNTCSPYMHLSSLLPHGPFWFLYFCCNQIWHKGHLLSLSIRSWQGTAFYHLLISGDIWMSAKIFLSLLGFFWAIPCK